MLVHDDDITVLLLWCKGIPFIGIVKESEQDEHEDVPVKHDIKF